MLADSKEQRAPKLSGITAAIVAEAIDAVFAILSTVFGGLLLVLLLWSIGL